jgi:bacillopeptidase F
VITVVATDVVGNVSSSAVTVVMTPPAPEVPPLTITNVEPTQDIYRPTGTSVLISFDSEPGLGRFATFAIRVPLTELGADALPDNAYELPMMEMGAGHYVGFFTVPTNLYMVGQIVVYLKDPSTGRQASAVAPGKIWANIPIPQ